MVARDRLDTKTALGEMRTKQRKADTANPLANASVGGGRLRFYAGGELLIEDGNLTVAGTAYIDGELIGTGTLTWSGAANLNGTNNLSGTNHLSGPTDLTGTLTINSPGKLVVAGSIPVTLGITASGYPGLDWGAAGYVAANTGRIVMASGSAGVQAISGSAAALVYGANSIGVGATGTVVQGNFIATGGTKSFRMDHPTKPGMWLTHASTESPVSGIEYWGAETIGVSGKKQVNLPDYFEALAKPAGRTVLVTGNGFAAGWTEIADNKFKVTGEPGGTFSWLVKAERYGADFAVESKADAPVDFTVSPPAEYTPEQPAGE